MDRFILSGMAGVIEDKQASSLRSDMTAKEFETRLRALATDEELRKYQLFLDLDVEQQDPTDYFIGVRMGSIFALSKEFIDMPVAEIEKLMESPVHELRVGALSIMGQCAKSKKCSDERLEQLYELYIRRHDRINHWGLVDLAAHHVVGRHLADKDRSILYDLARSANPWERRTAMVATAHFILKLKQTADTFALAELLLNENEDTVNKASGWMLRTAGDIDRDALLGFLDRHAATMPRAALRNAIEKFPKDQRAHYLALKRSS